MGVLENLPLKNLVPIFIVSFLMIFSMLFLMEPAMYCGEDAQSPTGCIVTDSGSFIIGLLISGVLFLLDMGLLYMTLGDFLLPKGPADE